MMCYPPTCYHFQFKEVKILWGRSLGTGDRGVDMRAGGWITQTP